MVCVVIDGRKAAKVIGITVGIIGAVAAAYAPGWAEAGEAVHLIGKVVAR